MSTGWLLTFVTPLVIVIGAVSPAAAQVTRVRIAADGPVAVYDRRTPDSTVLMLVQPGTVLEALDREHSGFWVVLPPDEHGTRQVGWIPEAFVEVLPASSARPPPVESGTVQDLGQRAILEFAVNEVNQGEVLVFVGDPDIWVDVKSLRDAGLRTVAGRQQPVGGELYVSLASLAPAVRFAFDEQALALRVTASPELFGRTVLDLRVGRPPGIEYARNSTAFLNYALNWRRATTTEFNAVAEAGVSVLGALTSSTMTLTAGGRVVRGLTSMTVDHRGQLARWVLGDSFATTGILGGSVFLGGLGVGREFGLDPYFVRYPTLAFSSAVTTPSTIEVYVNDRLVRQANLPPGTFELTKLPMPSGRADARIVIRDAFGRERQLASPFYLTTTTLERGLQEYSYHVGYVREGFGSASWDYRAPALLARHRVGITNFLTMGVRLEAAASLVSGGPAMSLRLPVGEIELAGAMSRDRQTRGSAATARYAFASRVFSIGAAVQAYSPRYAHLSLRAGEERPRMEASGFAGLQLHGLTSVTLEHVLSEPRTGERRERTALTTNTRIGAQANLSVTASRSRQPEGRVRELFVGLSIFLGRRTVGTLSFEQRNGQNEGALELQRNPPVGEGFGYRLQATEGPQRLGSARAVYQGRFGRYELVQDVTAGQRATGISVSGGLVAIGRGVYATRPLQDAFAVVRVPGVAGVRAYVSNQPVGRTGRTGSLLVPNLLAYYGNRLAIGDLDIPLHYEIGATEQTVAPPYRGGAVVTFPVRPLQSTTGRIELSIEGRTLIPAWGQLGVTVGGRSFESPIGSGGEFYLESLPAGAHAAVVQYGETACRFVMKVPRPDSPITHLGTLRCVVSPRDSVP